MDTEKKRTGIIIAAIFLFMIVAPVKADWDPGDGYKMHYPQLPNATGWDVECDYSYGVPIFLGDDWRCTETGPVTDIHIWGSWIDDEGPFDQPFRLEIRTDNQSGAYSKPETGTPLWQHNFSSGEYTFTWNETGLQSFFNPVIPRTDEDNHKNTSQYNFYIDPAEAFVQQDGNIYWLVVLANFEGIEGEYGFGWKTSRSQQFEDDAVFWNESIMDWSELRDPITNESLDLAFVITSEPQPSPVSALTPIGLLALVGILSVITALAITKRKRR